MNPNSIKNLERKKNFNKGEDERRNTKGAPVGSRWSKTLLKDLLTLELSENEMEMFGSMKEKFPSLFTGSEAKNLQLMLELKQISLAMHKNPRVSQAAIIAIKDRIEGKPKQTVDLAGELKTNIVIKETRTYAGNSTDIETDDSD